MIQRNPSLLTQNNPSKLVNKSGIEMIQGTEQLMAFAARLRVDHDNSLAMMSMKQTAADCLIAAQIIERLAPLEPDLDTQPGEN